MFAVVVVVAVGRGGCGASDGQRAVEGFGENGFGEPTTAGFGAFGDGGDFEGPGGQGFGNASDVAMYVDDATAAAFGGPEGCVVEIEVPPCHANSIHVSTD